MAQEGRVERCLSIILNFDAEYRALWVFLWWGFRVIQSHRSDSGVEHKPNGPDCRDGENSGGMTGSAELCRGKQWLGKKG